MTETELAAVISAIAPVVRECITKAVADLTPRLAAVEARIDVLGDLRDRVVTVETKAAMPSPPLPMVPDLAPVLERVAATEARVLVLGDLRDRVVAVETKAAQPPAPPTEKVIDLSPVFERLATAELRLKTVEATPLPSVVAELQKDIGAMRERIAVVEVRPPLPGPPGEPGAPGKDGKDGEPGAPGLAYEGVYQDGKSYTLGTIVTWAGSSWHCNEPTDTKPGDGSKAWTLMVKRGRDGKDGAQGAEGKPGRDLTKEVPSWQRS